MEFRGVVPFVLLIAGIGLLLYGQFVAEKSGAYLYVENEPVQQSELPTDADIVAFDTLPPDLQAKFKHALRGNTQYLGVDPPLTFPDELRDGGFVHYSGAYYRTGILWVDAAIDVGQLSSITGLVVGVHAALWGAYELLIRRRGGR